MTTIVVWILIVFNTQPQQISLHMPDKMYFATQTDCEYVKDKLDKNFLKAGCLKTRIVVPK